MGLGDRCADDQQSNLDDDFGSQYGFANDVLPGMRNVWGYLHLFRHCDCNGSGRECCLFSVVRHIRYRKRNNFLHGWIRLPVELLAKL